MLIHRRIAATDEPGTRTSRAVATSTPAQTRAGTDFDHHPAGSRKRDRFGELGHGHPSDLARPNDTPHRRSVALAATSAQPNREV
jgi:hypothetical protein